MATGDYCTISELKYRLWPTDETPDNEEDIIFQSIITAVSRMIDRTTGRRFYTTAADETRYYTAEDGEVLYPDDDIQSVTTLYTDYDGDGTYEDTWTDSDFILLPANAALDSIPYTYIEIAPFGDYSFPIGIRKGVKIVGKFGYSSSTTPQNTPAMVKEACLLQSMRLYKRRDAPFGIVQSPPGGEMRLLQELDPDVKLLLFPVTRFF